MAHFALRDVRARYDWRVSTPLSWRISSLCKKDFSLYFYDETTRPLNNESVDEVVSRLFKTKFIDLERFQEHVPKEQIKYN